MDTPANPGADGDYDRLSALQEFLLGTSDSNADTDGDGESDHSEVLGGTDPLDPASFTLSAPLEVVLTQGTPSAPFVRVLRDDRVATLELDYVPGNPWTPFDQGQNGNGPVGYALSWWPVGAPAAAQSKVTSLRRTQIQPLWNGSPYVVQVQYVNGLGQLLPGTTEGVVHGGNDKRVNALRSSMTGFFDDFNRPAGLPDELGWNTTFSKVNDPALQGFFINGQFHTHTLVGTPPLGYGDRGQTTHRVRTSLRLEAGETRRIAFDLDGVGVAQRTVWYLDLLNAETDITSHFSIDGGPGFPGHPSPGLRFKLVAQELSLWSITGAGEQILIVKVPTLDWDGVQTFPNVRRAFELLVSEQRAIVKIDGQTLLDEPLGVHALVPADYTVHWTAFGYNTMKVNLPYMLLHWDNFGFDGPQVAPRVHNYRSQIAGTDYVQSQGHQVQVVPIPIPDVLTPTQPGVMGQATLHFTRQMSTHSPAAWDPADSVTVGGQVFAIPAPTSTTNPPLPLATLISANAPYSTRIPLGSVGAGGTAPLVEGTNNIEFRADQCGFHNVHIEVHYPAGTAPTYTPPQAIHPVPVHHHYPRVGVPARITSVGSNTVFEWMDDLNDPAVFQPTVSGTIEIGTVVNGDLFNGLRYLRSNFTGGQLAGNGENPGIQRVELRIRADGAPASSAILIGALDTDTDVPAPQVAHSFEWDTASLSNGTYELTLHAWDTFDVESIPDYSHAGEAAGSASALNGFDFPLHLIVVN